MNGYPATPQEMVDRLLTDRPFLIRTVVNDNFPAVRANFVEQIQSGFPERINTPEKLVNQMLWWDKHQGGPDVIDPVLAVPYRATTGSAVLNAANAQLQQMAAQTDGHPKGLVIGLVSLVGSLVGSGAQQQASNAAAQAAAAEAAAAEARRREANARAIRWGVGLGIVLLAIAAFIYFRK